MNSETKKSFDIADQLDITIKEDEELSFQMLEEFKDGKGDEVEDE